MPIIESLQIEEAKIVDYLLDVNHVDGGDKAAFFLGRGFTIDAPDELAEALATHAATHWPGRVVTTSYVTKHIVEGPLTCPDGSTPNVLAVWKLDSGEPTAWLVTAYRRR